MVYQIAYCDDELSAGQVFAQRIIAAFGDCGAQISLTCFSSSLRLMQSICAGCAFDALFLDIDMAELDGITLCRRLREQGFNPTVVFLSNKEEMVYQTFHVQPVRFLRKSCFSAEIKEAVSAVLKRIKREQSEAVTFDDGKRLYRLPVLELVYLEIMNQTLTAYLRHSSVHLKYKLNDAEALLQPYGFLRIHKSFLVNYRAIFSICKDSVLLDDGRRLPLSRHRYAEVKQAFMERSRMELQEMGDF